MSKCIARFNSLITYWSSTPHKEDLHLWEVLCTKSTCLQYPNYRITDNLKFFLVKDSCTECNSGWVYNFTQCILGRRTLERGREGSQKYRDKRYIHCIARVVLLRKLIVLFSINCRKWMRESLQFTELSPITFLRIPHR